MSVPYIHVHVYVLCEWWLFLTGVGRTLPPFETLRNPFSTYYIHVHVHSVVAIFDFLIEYADIILVHVHVHVCTD